MSFDNSGLCWDRRTLRAYLSTLHRPEWCKGVTFHHTWNPSLAMRPKGFSEQLMDNLRSYYEVTLRWKAGPHFFADDRLAWGMTPPNLRGIHAVGFNRSRIGIEVLGNFDAGRDSATEGRGLLCWQNAAWIAAEVLGWLLLKPHAGTINFHRDDPATSKTCPGTTIRKEWAVKLVTECYR